MTFRFQALTMAIAVALATPVSAQAPGSTPEAKGGAASTARKAGTGAPATRATPPRGDALAPGSGAGSIGTGLPAIGGVTPNRAELASSAFTKLDAHGRGYLTLEETRQLDGFERAFRQSDRNADGRLSAEEFSAAWAMFTGNVR